MHSLKGLLRLRDALSSTRTSLACLPRGSWLGWILDKNGLTSDATSATGVMPSHPLEATSVPSPSPGITDNLQGLQRVGKADRAPRNDATARRIWQRKKSYRDNTPANLELLGRWGMTPENQHVMRTRSVRLPAISPDHLEDKLKWMVKELGFTAAEVVHVLQNAPNFLNHSVGGKLAPFKEMFVNEGVNIQDIKAMIIRFPRLMRDANKIHMMCEFFGSELNLSRRTVLTMLLRHPRLLTYSIGDNVSMHMARLKNLGLSSDDIGSIFERCPGLIGRDFDNVIKQKLNWLGCEFGMDQVDTVALFKSDPQPFVASLDTWKRSLEYFLSMGLTKEAIAKDWVCLFGWRPEGLHEMKTFALEVLRKSEEEILECPVYFKTPFAKVVLLRVGYLGSKGEDYIKVPLRDLCELQPKEFFSNFSMAEVNEFEEKWAPLEKAKKMDLIRTGYFSF